MVLVKMLMKIALPKMGDCWWWRRWRFPPPGGKYPRQNSSVGALDWFPPRDGGVWSRKPSYDFSQVKTPHIGEDGHRGTCGGPTRQGAPPERGGAPPPSWTAGAPPSDLLSPDIFYILWNGVLWSFGAFWVVQNRFPEFAPFPAQNSSCRHSPSSCKPCKIR